MKTSEAPDKIYAYIPNDDIVGTASLKKGLPHQYVTEEYTRTDVFINKVCDWIEDNIYDYLYINRDFNDADYKNELIEDLRKAMEKE